MLTAIVVSLLAPVAGLLLLRRLSPRVVADLRGIALQTVIIMVVLLAVAGAVAGVLLARGGEAVSDIDRAQVTRQASDYNSPALCSAAGFTWGSVGTTASGGTYASGCR